MPVPEIKDFRGIWLVGRELLLEFHEGYSKRFES